MLHILLLSKWIYIFNKTSFSFWRVGSTFGDTVKLKLLKHEERSLLCDPGMNHRQPLSMVASSRAIHIPITLPRGFVFRNEASWCGVTKCVSMFTARTWHFKFCIWKKACLFTFTTNPWLLEEERNRNSYMLNSTAFVVIWWSIFRGKNQDFTLKMYILCSTTGRANPSIFAML